jgi:hypothetical protein
MSVSNLKKSNEELLPSYRLPPDLREWALRQATEEEIVAGLKEVRENGGMELGELIDELTQGLQDCDHPIKALSNAGFA